jgi:hypothetical protein
MKIPKIGEPPLNLTIGTLQLTSSFCTDSSISFDVKSGGRRGWIDVHYPCQGHIKVQIRGALPEDWLESSKLNSVISAVRRELDIPEDETFEAIFFKPTKNIGVENSVNREGVTNGI